MLSRKKKKHKPEKKREPSPFLQGSELALRIQSMPINSMVDGAEALHSSPQRVHICPRSYASQACCQGQGPTITPELWGTQDYRSRNKMGVMDNRNHPSSKLPCRGAVWRGGEKVVGMDGKKEWMKGEREEQKWMEEGRGSAPDPQFQKFYYVS